LLNYAIIVQEDYYRDKYMALATFSGGCFWCMEAAFQTLDGVTAVVSGYTGGEKENPTYEEVSSGTTGHYEVIQVTYDPEIISYQELLDFYWKNIDPTDEGGQFVDRGPQYRTAIFYHDEEQKKLAEESKENLEKEKFRHPLATKILLAKKFYQAEGYHQGYYKNNRIRYELCKKGSGRDKRLKELWD